MSGELPSNATKIYDDGSVGHHKKVGPLDSGVINLLARLMYDAARARRGTTARAASR